MTWRRTGAELEDDPDAVVPSLRTVPYGVAGCGEAGVRDGGHIPAV
ncbi:hypothetical protein AB0N06_00910 [Streptomyces sp. NPDC051020]